MITLTEFTESVTQHILDKTEMDIDVIGGEPIVRIHFKKGEFTWFSVQNVNKITRTIAKDVATGALYNYQVWAEKRNINIGHWSTYEA